MEHAAPPIPRLAPPDPAQDRPGRAASSIPARLAVLLQIVRVLLGHGRRLAETAPDRAADEKFAILAAVCGTYNLPSILIRFQRGIMRALALERYLLARAGKGRDIAFVEWRERSSAKPPGTQPVTQSAEPPEETQQPSKPARRPFDPDNLHIPTEEELDAEVRRRPIGRTVALICMDLAVIPSFCTGTVWNQIFDTLQYFGGSLAALYKVRAHRETSFQKERDHHPESWGLDWQYPGPDTVRQVLGCLIGEAPVSDPFDPLLATAPP